jgi:rod shape-determining protein MreD
MTLLDPGNRRTEADETPQLMAPLGPTPLPASPSVGIALSPESGRSVSADAAPIVVSGTARLGFAILLVLAVLLQRVLLPELPYGPADVVTVLVACFALFAGPASGCVAGFGAGLVADALSDHALGRLAAVLCVVGYLCGLLADRRKVWIAWPLITVACVATPLLFGLTGAFVGDHRAGGELLLTRCIAGASYGFVLAPFAYFLLWRLFSPRRRKSRTRHKPTETFS